MMNRTICNKNIRRLADKINDDYFTSKSNVILISC